MENVLLGYSIFILVAGSYLAFVTIVNIIYLIIYSHQGKKEFTLKEGEKAPKISVLIPARNEETRIRPTLNALLNQNYPNYEICVLNDSSTDSTGDILAEYQAKSSKIKIFNGKPLAEGWKGKPHALQQLIDQTDGDYVICLDADLTVSEDFISWSILRMLKTGVDSMSAWPRHNYQQKREYIVCPAIYTLTSFLMPLWLIHTTKNKFFAFAIQFAIYKREALEKIGGYAAAKNVMNEDLGMAREMKAAGYKTIFLDAKRKIRGDMYENFSSAVTGIERSIASVFENKLYPILILSIFLFIALILPPFFVLAVTLLQASGWYLGIIGISLFCGSWIFAMINRRLNPLSWFIFPVTYSAIIFLAWRSYFRSRTGKGFIWKGRKVV